MNIQFCTTISVLVILSTHVQHCSPTCPLPLSSLQQQQHPSRCLFFLLLREPTVEDAVVAYLASKLFFRSCSWCWRLRRLTGGVNQPMPTAGLLPYCGPAVRQWADGATTSGWNWPERCLSVVMAPIPAHSGALGAQWLGVGVQLDYRETNELTDIDQKRTMNAPNRRPFYLLAKKCGKNQQTFISCTSCELHLSTMAASIYDRIPRCLSIRNTLGGWFMFVRNSSACCGSLGYSFVCQVKSPLNT